MGEGGINLSGAQRQRLAIARSIVSKPPISNIDEATSSIDVRGEKAVQAALDRVSKKRTTIMIAHRLSTVRKADNIVVMQEGTCVEEGSHSELMLKGGVYHALVNAEQLDPLAESQDSDAEETFRSYKETELPLEYLVDEGEEGQPGVQKTKGIGFSRSLAVIVYEHRAYWFLFLITILCAVGSGCKCPSSNQLPR